MPRQPRIEYGDAVYHVMARGNRREAIFLDDEDRGIFLRTLGEACERAGIRVYAWVLMGNHYHLVLRTPNANLIEAMGWLQNTYTRRFDARHRQWGRLFGDRYKSILVDEESGSRRSRGGDYLRALIDYVHLNPARARIVRARKGGSILDYPWSSLAQGYALPPARRAAWLEVAEALALSDCEDTTRGRRRYIALLDECIVAEATERCGLAQVEGQSLQSTLRRGWYWGSEAFREKMLALARRQAASATNRNYAGSPQGKDRSRRMADEILSKAGAHFGLESRGSVGALGRGDRRRAAIAWALWRKTGVPQRWIAEHTGLKSAANVSQQVRRYDEIPAAKLSAKERRWKEIVSKFVD